MGLLTLSPDIPWLSLVWLSMVVPAIIIALLPATQQEAMRWTGTIFAFISLLLALLLFLAYDPQQAGFQFVERLEWMPQLGISYQLGVDGMSLPMLLLNGVVIFTGA